MIILISQRSIRICQACLNFLNKKSNKYEFISKLNQQMDNSEIFCSGIYSQPESEGSLDQSVNQSSSSRLSRNSGFEAESFVKGLLKLRKQFQAIKSLLRKKKLNEDKLQVAQSWGLEKVFQIRCPELLEKRKEFFNHCESFFKKMSLANFQEIEKQPSRKPNSLKEQPRSQADQAEKTDKTDKKAKIDLNSSEEPRDESKRLINSEADSTQLSSQTLRNPYLYDAVNRDEIQQKHLSLIHQPKLEEKISSSASQQQAPQEQEYKRQFRKRQGEKEQQEKREEERKGEEKAKEQQKESEEDKLKKKLDNINFHINWQNKAAFYVQDKLIRKLHNNDYRKICGLDPFKDGIIYNIKFKILKLGTVAFGIVSKQNKGGLFIDNRYVDTLKFITFFNGDGGKLILNGEELKTGRLLAMQPGDEVHFVFDFKDWKLTYKAPRMRNPQTVNFITYKGQQMYPYVEMKQQDTSIEFL